MSISVQFLPPVSVQNFPVSGFQVIGFVLTIFTVFEPERIVAYFKDVAMVRETVKQSRGHFGIAEDLHPFTQGKMGREQPC